MQPDHQPTVTTDKSRGIAAAIALIVGLVAAWAFQTYFLDRDRAPTVATAAEVAAPPPVPEPTPAAVPQESASTIPEPAPPAPPSPSPQPPAPIPIAVAPGAPSPSASNDRCDRAIADSGMQLPDDFRVIAAGAYGGRPLGYKIDESGHMATQLDVVVSSQGQPVALMLGAYEPTVWNLSWTPGTRLVAVYVGGYHAQRIGGLPRNVPLLTSSYEERKAGSGCPYFYVGGEGGSSSLDEAASRVFHHAVDRVYHAGDEGTVFIGATAQLGPMPTRGPSDYRDNLMRPAGKEGLDQAIQLGQIRRAGPGDALLWSQAMAQRKGRAYDPAAGQQPDAPPSNLYIVTGPFVYPSGLYGATAVMFLVPPGVPTPRGDPGHSAVYLMR
jgi:hypothetical protein